jgi:phosphocarrier protein FPr
LLLRRPDLLLPQLRAVYRAAASCGNLSLMFPMVTSLPEVIALRGHCEQVRSELAGPVIPIGIMIEVPAAALLVEQLSQHVDFFSVGTNDLTQYALAMDRQNAALAAEADSMHPAVLRLIAIAAAGARRAGRPISVCGGLAGDPLGALALAGLGIEKLSMSPGDIPRVKASLRKHSMAELEAIARQALDASTADDVRALLGRLA